MHSPAEHASNTAVRSEAAILVGLVLVALNLRPALSSVGPVALQIQADTGWNDVWVGALTTLPVLSMGIFALAVPRIAARVGRARTIVFALVLLAVALLMRLGGMLPGVLHLSALLAGIGIALAVGLVPGVVREQLHHAAGRATGAWSTALMAGAALGAAFTVPISHATGSWQIALAVWAVPAIVGTVAWAWVERPAGAAGVHTNDDGSRRVPSVRDLPWRSRAAWALTAYLALNSIVFYVTVAWLAPSYAERGWTQADAGYLFGVYTAASVVATLVLAPLSHRMRARRVLLVAISLVTAVALVLIGIAPDFAPVAVLAVFGFVLGGGFGIGLLLLADYAADAAGSARLTAMVFFVVYTVAAIGPMAIGALLDALDSWPIAFGLLAALAAVQALAAIPLRRGITIR